VDAAAASLRTSSAPSARLYERLGWLIGGLYDRFADEAAAAVAGIADPRVLEVGPGPGEVAVRLEARVPGLQLTGLDIDPSMVALAEARAARAGVSDRVRYLTGDVAAMPLEDASFDLVLSSFSAHHWPDGPAGFSEIRRVLRPGGRALVYDLPDGWGHLETGAAGRGCSRGQQICRRAPEPGALARAPGARASARGRAAVDPRTGRTASARESEVPQYTNP
jgi:SAM-dependent methyltransferase